MKTTTPPKPHIPKKPKAFVLGCDPTAFLDQEKTQLRQLKKVFGIGEDGRYFAGILSNLNHLGLDLENVYVQNLVREYLEKEISKNKKVWIQEARKRITDRKKEFDRADPERKWPVFLTSWLLYDVLLNVGLPRKSPKELYESAEIIPTSQNQLGRTLIPLFRHHEYKYPKWFDYGEKVRGFIK